jgi:molybdopterin converting factor small subunit
VTTDMPTIYIPGPLRAITAGATSVAARGATVAEALADLDARHTGFLQRVLDREGRIKSSLRVFVGSRDVVTLELLETPLDPDDEIVIVPAIAGG